MRSRVWPLFPVVFAGACIAVACGSSSSGDDSDIATTDGSVTDGTFSGDGSSSRDGSARDGAIDAAVFSPTDFGSRLVLWLDSSQMLTLVDAGIDAAPGVDGWGDLSTAKNNAHLFSGSPREASGDAGLNGHPVVSLDNDSILAIPESTSLIWGTGDFSLFVVFANESATFALVAGKYDENAPFPGPNLYANFFMPVPSTKIAARLDSTHYTLEEDDSGSNDDKFRMVGMRRSGARLELRIDGVSTISDAGYPDGGAVDVTAPDASFYIGGRPTGSPMSGRVAEVIGIKGTLSDADVDALEAYLKTKYGL
jgi:hypothetical protein